MYPKTLISAIFGTLIFLLFCETAVSQTTRPNNNFPDSAFLNAHPPSTPSSNNIQRVGAWPYGPALAVAVDEPRDLIFLGSGGVVLILDGQDRTNPQLLSESIHTFGLVEDIKYDTLNQRLLLACGEGGLEIWDVQDPAHPQFLSRKEVLYFGVETPVGEVDLYQNLVFAECGFGGVHSLDVSDPTNPVQIAFNAAMGNPASNIHVSQEDGQLHTTGAQFYLRLSIQPNGTLNNSGGREFLFGAGDVYGKQDVAFVSYGGAMYILDLFAPGFLPWSITDVGGISEMEVPGDTAYIVNRDGFHVYDVSVYNSPNYVGSLNDTFFTANLAVANGYAYITDSQGGLHIIDIGDGTNPTEVGYFDVVGVTWQSVLSGNYSYVAHSNDGMFVLDVSDPSNPQKIGEIASNGETREIAVQDTIAYLADWTGGLRTVNISDPQNPVELGVYDAIDAWRVVVNGQYAYVIEAIANMPYWLRVLDISDLGNPVEIGALQFPGSVDDIVARNDTVYAAADNAGLRIIDVSNPTNPVEIGNYPLQRVSDIFLRDQTVFLASWDHPNGGFVILDVSDPTSPALIGQYSDPGFSPFNLYVEGDYAILDDTFGELHMFFIEDLSNPQLVEQYLMPDLVTDIFVKDSLVYVSNARVGTQIVKNELYIVGIPGEGEFDGIIPASVELHQNYPNPFNPTTTIRYNLPRNAKISLKVYNVLGETIRTLVDDLQSAGSKSVVWDGRNDYGKTVSSGIYFYRLQSKNSVQTKKMMLLK